MTESLAELQQLCTEAGIRRFSPEEMVELLQEGETVDWILEQILPDSPPGSADRLRPVLQLFAREEAVGEKMALEDAVATEAQTAQETTEFTPDSLEDIELPPGVDLEQIKGMMDSPQGALLADFGSFCEERNVDTRSQGDEMAEVMQVLHEEWVNTPREALQGKRPAELLEGGRLFPHKVETFRREQPKIGRNDPCPCASGKKYKRCCGMEA